MTSTAAESTAVTPKKRSLYLGDPGMWSWVAHRITGVTVFFFLFVHVLDTALVRVNPATYDAVVETYKNPLVGLMELGLVFSVLFHGLNGVRVILVDFWAEGPRHQKMMLWIVIALTLILFAGASGRQIFLMFNH